MGKGEGGKGREGRGGEGGLRRMGLLVVMERMVVFDGGSAGDDLL